jgi:hypothetical protein
MREVRLRGAVPTPVKSTTAFGHTGSSHRSKKEGPDKAFLFVMSAGFTWLIMESNTPNKE